MKPPFISLTDALAQYKAEVSSHGTVMRPEMARAFDDVFCYGYFAGAATVCRLLLAMSEDAQTLELVEVFRSELLALHNRQQVKR